MYFLRTSKCAGGNDGMIEASLMNDTLINHIRPG